jgi:two-component system, LytTR family, sensor kinase
MYHGPRAFPFRKISMSKPRLLRWLAVLLVWTLLAAGFSALGIYVNFLRGERETWWTIFSYYLASFWLWAVFSIFIYRMAERFPIDRGNWPKLLLLHLPTSILICLLHSAIFLLIYSLIDYTPTRMYKSVADIFGSERAYFLAIQQRELMAYWVLLVGSYAITFYKSYQREKLGVLQLRAQLAEAELQALRMQLHPHFLFNTLNSISALVHKDPEAADEMIGLLGDFLRLTLERPSAQEVTLEEELRFLECYLEIERVRFHDRLSVSIDVDPRALAERVPNLILQPIIENAVRHGIAPHAKAGRIEIRSEVEGDRLRLQVSDDGPGLPAASARNGRGVGLSNTRARLEKLYGAKHRFELANGAAGGLVVTMEIPLHS